MNRRKLWLKATLFFLTGLVMTCFMKTGNAAVDNAILSQQIETLSNADTTRYSVYAAFPEENHTPYLYQSEPMRSASMIKVFLLADAMEKVRDGQLSLDQALPSTPVTK